MAVTSKKVADIPPTDPDLIPIASGVETWRNNTPGTVFINRIGEYGRKTTEIINGGRAFAITPQERRLNQNAVADTSLDMFTNGTLQPVSLLDSEPDTESLRANPNTLTDRDIQRLFKQRGEAFSDRIATITNQAAIARVLEMAREPRWEVTLSQYEVVKLRELELKGELNETAPPTADPNTAGLPKAVTPR